MLHRSAEHTCPSTQQHKRNNKIKYKKVETYLIGWETAGFRSSEDWAETFFTDWTETFFGASLADARTAGFGASKSSRDCADASTAGFGASRADARTAGFGASESTVGLVDVCFGASKSTGGLADTFFGCATLMDWADMHGTGLEGWGT